MLLSLILGVYVDDIIFLGTSSAITSWFHQLISHHFSIIINFKISSLLGMKIDHDLPEKIITISQPGNNILIIINSNTILERCNINQTLSKFTPKIPFSSYDLTWWQSNFSFKTGSIIVYTNRGIFYFYQLFLTLISHFTLIIYLYFWNLNSMAFQESTFMCSTILPMLHTLIENGNLVYQFIKINYSFGFCITISKQPKLSALSSTEADYLACLKRQKL